jgi:hypothetical protein
MVLRCWTFCLCEGVALIVELTRLQGVVRLQGAGVDEVEDKVVLVGLVKHSRTECLALPNVPST